MFIVLWILNKSMEAFWHSCDFMCTKILSLKQNILWRSSWISKGIFLEIDNQYGSFYPSRKKGRIEGFLWVTCQRKIFWARYYHSEIHATNIDLNNLIFKDKYTTAGLIRLENGLHSYRQGIQWISNRKEFWSSEITTNLKQYAVTIILPLVSSTHRVQAMVWDCSHVSSTDQG